jgi:hypothetical protein
MKQSNKSLIYRQNGPFELEALFYPLNYGNDDWEKIHQSNGNRKMLFRPAAMPRRQALFCRLWITRSHEIKNMRQTMRARSINSTR